ncbi:hypothetical protein AF71_00000350 [Rhizobium sp. 57MFTsu3.2]|nr:hypothetical protein [Rhizobium sp. 57MFTsu3.2]
MIAMFDAMDVHFEQEVLQGPALTTTSLAPYR